MHMNELPVSCVISAVANERNELSIANRTTIMPDLDSMIPAQETLSSIALE